MSQTATPAAEKPADLSDTEVERFLAGMVGPVGQPESMEIEFGAARRMALARDNHDPIHHDRAAALARGYRGVVAPWPLLWLVYFTCNDPDVHHDFPFGRSIIHGQDDYAFFEPIVVGDVVTMATAIVETKLKHGKSGRLGQLVEERSFTNQHGQLCATLRTTLFRR
jgi:acyl dehydratase